MASRYPIRAVAKITGLSLDTLRAWERRYQAVVPERTDRGRQYGAAQIERLMLLGQLVQKGHAIGQIASLSDQELQNLLVQQPGHPGPELALQKDFPAPVLAAIEGFDAARAGDELSRLAAVLTPRDLLYQVALPLMREVGVRWHDGTLAISQEHLVSQMLRNLLGGMMRLFRPSSTAVKMVFATPAGEAHEFGILAGAMLASISGVEPVYLGSNLPSREIANAAGRTGAKVIVLGITVLTETTAEEVSALAAAMPEACELWLGGAASADLDLTNLGTKIILIQDLQALENECRRWRNRQ
ncbi:MAG: MerR family transcriptional regulator [Bryobacteraceae bacterium]|jgi:DNA-binding transcriptional MerR regulator/methylmalonyl-CoA mutase cobalamin-binding subunit